MSGQLQINLASDGKFPTPLPYLTVPCSTRGTAVRLDVNSGKILGEYRTAPNIVPDPSPSRTTVDRFGNFWTGNRFDNDRDLVGGNDDGSLTRIGLVIGGIRGNKVGGVFVPDPNGQYLSPPLQYITCFDRDGDGLIKTSKALGDLLDWTGGSDLQGVTGAEDELILNYTRVSSIRGVRTLAVDKNNDVWAGGFQQFGETSRQHVKVSGSTGDPIPTAYVANPTYVETGVGTIASGGYGGLIDGQGRLWSASQSGKMMFYDPATGEKFAFGSAASAIPQRGGYGITVDPVNQDILSTHIDTSYFSRYTSFASWVSDHYHGFGEAQGLVADHRDHVWVAHQENVGLSIGRVQVRPNPLFLGNVPLTFSENVVPGPTGVTVDSNGKVWAAHKNMSTIVRINPALGYTNNSGIRIGEVDLTVDLLNDTAHPSGKSAEPYTYSDMTGYVYLSSTYTSGVWDYVHDSGINDHAWTRLSWDATTPTGTEIIVEVRAANAQETLPGSGNNPPTPRAFTSVLNNQTLSGVNGRFLELRVTLGKLWNGTQSPVLRTLTVHCP